MSHRRKHVTQALQQQIDPPTENQRIVKALNTRGGNIIEVRCPKDIMALQ